MADVVGFRVGLAFLLGVGSLGWSLLCTPMTAVPQPPGPGFVPITANTPALHLALVLRLAWQREPAGESCWGLWEGERRFTFPALMFSLALPPLAAGRGGGCGSTSPAVPCRAAP